MRAAADHVIVFVCRATYLCCCYSVATSAMVVKRKSPVIVNLLESMEFNFVQRLEKNRLFYILHSTIIVLSVCAFIAEESPEMEFVAARYWYH